MLAAEARSDFHIQPDPPQWAMLYTEKTLPNGIQQYVWWLLHLVHRCNGYSCTVGRDRSPGLVLMHDRSCSAASSAALPTWRASPHRRF